MFRDQDQTVLKGPGNVEPTYISQNLMEVFSSQLNYRQSGSLHREGYPTRPLGPELISVKPPFQDGPI